MALRSMLKASASATQVPTTTAKAGSSTCMLHLSLLSSFAAESGLSNTETSYTIGGAGTPLEIYE